MLGRIFVSSFWNDISAGCSCTVCKPGIEGTVVVGTASCIISHELLLLLALSFVTTLQLHCILSLLLLVQLLAGLHTYSSTTPTEKTWHEAFYVHFYVLISSFTALLIKHTFFLGDWWTSLLLFHYCIRCWKLPRDIVFCSQTVHSPVLSAP